ncbi:hypothetical protein QP157_11855 [Sphingomonas sp. LR61]|uniref:hypothetical protein n=1 Tax=Sphingomonas sp. LR61 TaxID=3050234 RepID=UPI002FE02659
MHPAVPVGDDGRRQVGARGVRHDLVDPASCATCPSRTAGRCSSSTTTVRPARTSARIATTASVVWPAMTPTGFDAATGHGADAGTTVVVGSGSAPSTDARSRAARSASLNV